MDYWETGLDRDRRPVKAFMHYGFDRGLDLQRRFVLSDVAGNPLDGTAWHVVQLDWLDYGSGVMAVSVDGRLVAVGLDDVDCARQRLRLDHGCQEAPDDPARRFQDRDGQPGEDAGRLHTGLPRGTMTVT